MYAASAHKHTAKLWISPMGEIAISQCWIMLTPGGAVTKSLSEPDWPPQESKGSRKAYMPRLQAIFEQQDEQVKSIMLQIEATERAPQMPFYPPPDQAWESIAVLSEQSPWGHIAIEPAMLTQGAISVDQHRLFGNIAAVPQVTPELLLSIPSVLAAIMAAIGDT